MLFEAARGAACNGCALLNALAIDTAVKSYRNNFTLRMRPRQLPYIRPGIARHMPKSPKRIARCAYDKFVPGAPIYSKGTCDNSSIDNDLAEIVNDGVAFRAIVTEKFSIARIALGKMKAAQRWFAGQRIL